MFFLVLLSRTQCQQQELFQRDWAAKGFGWYRPVSTEDNGSYCNLLQGIDSRQPIVTYCIDSQQPDLLVGTVELSSRSKVMPDLLMLLLLLLPDNSSCCITSISSCYMKLLFLHHCTHLSLQFANTLECKKFVNIYPVWKRLACSVGKSGVRGDRRQK